MNFNFFKTGLALAMGLVIQSATFAQTLVPPSGAAAADLFLAAGGVNGINTALINIPLNNYRDRQLAACAYDGGAAGAGGFVVKDLYSGVTVNVPYPVGGFSGNHMASVPDVIMAIKAVRLASLYWRLHL